MGVKNVRQITHLFGGLKREMILLIKTFEFLKTIEKKFGEPLNTYQYIVKNVKTQYNATSKAIMKHGNLSFGQHIDEWLRDLHMKFLFFIFRIYIKFTEIFGKNHENAENYVY